MGDFTTFEFYNVPIFMYSMIGLTLGVITMSTLYDDTNGLVTSGVFQAPASEIRGGKRRKTQRKKH
jgi:hypothetical protein